MLFTRFKALWLWLYQYALKHFDSSYTNMTKEELYSMIKKNMYTINKKKKKKFGKILLCTQKHN